MSDEIRSRMRRDMDALRFSSEAREAMAASLMNQCKEKNMKRNLNSRRLLLVSLAAVLLLATLTGAAAFTRWTRSAGEGFHMTGEQMQKAEESGLSLMLTEPGVLPGESILSCTDQGVTITAVQTLVDRYQAYMVFRIDGFDLPEGAYPKIRGGVVELDGESPAMAYAMGFYNGVVFHPDGTETYMDGTPVEHDAKGNRIWRLLGEDGSLEYHITLTLPHQEETYVHQSARDASFFGSEVEVQFTSIGIEGEIDGDYGYIPLVEGSWTLQWTLSGSEDIRVWEDVDHPLGDSGVTIRRIELTPLTCVLFLEGIDPSWDAAYVMPQLHGVILEDGRMVYCPVDMLPSQTLMEDGLHSWKQGIQAVELDRVRALAICNLEDPSGEDYIVPIPQ